MRDAGEAGARSVASPTDDALLGASNQLLVGKLEEKVRELEMERIRLADVLRVAGIGSWMTDPTSLAVWWSEETHRIFETDPGTFQPTHQKFLDMVHADDREAVHRAFEESFDLRDLQTIEHRIVLADGRSKHVEERWRVFHDERDRPIRVVGTSRDVTERRRAYADLRHSEAQLRRTFADAAIGIALCSLDGRILDCNAAFARMLARSQEELRGVDLSTLTHPDDRRRCGELLRELLEERRASFVAEKRCLTKDGRTVWSRVSVAVQRDTLGRASGIIHAAEDITEQKAAEEARQQLETRLAETLENITDAFFTLDPAWRFTYLNREAERLLARPRGELLGRNVWQEFPEAVGTTFQREYARAVDRGETVAFEEYYPPLATWFGVRAYPSGQGLAVYFRDIGASRQSEQALRASEERLRLLSLATNEAIRDWDLSTGALWWNDCFETLFGYARTSVSPTLDFWIERIHPEDERRVVDELTRAIESDTNSWSGEYRFRRSDGHHVWIFDRSYIMRDAAGKALRVICGMNDRTERRLAEAKLVEQAALLDKAQDAIIVCDLEHRITYWNKSAENLYGWTAAEAIGRAARELLHVDPEAFDAAMRLLLADGEWIGEFVHQRRGGATLIVEGRWTLVGDPRGLLRSVLAINTDVSERRKLEIQLRQSQKMEAVGRFAGGVAHDFNNLLTVIIGCSEQLCSLPDAGGAAREPLQAIREAADRAADLTRKLLGFSRQSILQPKVLDLNAVVTETTALLRRVIGEDILFATVLDPNIGRIKVDPVQLDQILMNLAANARDAMPGGGKLTIETKSTVLDDEYAVSHPDCRPGRHVMLAITDTGAGMTAEVLAHVFEPFYTTKGVGNGTGLGLATVYGIVQQSGGSIHVYSEPRHGTSFKIYLPVVDELPSIRGAQIAQPDLRGKETILLVEDDAQLRSLAATSLRSRGYAVLTATDGRDALEVAAAHRQGIDLLLTDVMMPKLGGPELASQLSARLPDIKVLFMSGYADYAVVRHGLLEDRVAFIQKPYTQLQLARKLRQVLGGAPTAS